MPVSLRVCYRRWWQVPIELRNLQQMLICDFQFTKYRCKKWLYVVGQTDKRCFAMQKFRSTFGWLMPLPQLPSIWWSTYDYKFLLRLSLWKWPEYVESSLRKGPKCRDAYKLFWWSLRYTGKLLAAVTFNHKVDNVLLHGRHVKSRSDCFVCQSSASDVMDVCMLLHGFLPTRSRLHLFLSILSMA